MRIHSFQHVPFEDIGSMAQDFAARGYPVTTTHWYRGGHAPGLASFDALIVMGGPMGIHDEASYPWLADEKRFIKQAINAGKIVIGVCLGAQLIADVLGGSVTRNTYKEIGWWPLQIAVGAADHPVARILAHYPEVFHWHGDTFATPPDATLIASSEGCANQAYVFNEKIYGFQFHLETTPASAAALIAHCAADIDGSRYTQTAESMTSDSTRFESINRAMSHIIGYIFDAKL